MNYQDRLEHLTHLITEQERCPNTKAHQLLADALGSNIIEALILWEISLRRKPPSHK